MSSDSTVTLTTFRAWNGHQWVEQPAPPVTTTGEGWQPVLRCVMCAVNCEVSLHLDQDGGPYCDRCYARKTRPICTQPVTTKHNTVAPPCAPEWHCLGDPDDVPCMATGPCVDCRTIQATRQLALPEILHEMHKCNDEDLHHHADRILCGLALELAERTGDTAIVERIIQAYNVCPKWYE